MTLHNLMEESDLLYHASISSKLVSLINRYSRTHGLIKRDTDVIERCIEFIDSAIEGFTLVSRTSASLAPDAESVEIYGYIARALELVEDLDNGPLEGDTRELERVREILQKLKNNDLSEENMPALKKVQAVFRHLTPELVRRSATTQSELVWEHLLS